MTSCLENPLDSQCTCSKLKVYDINTKEYRCCGIINVAGEFTESTNCSEYTMNLEPWKKLYQIFSPSTSNTENTRILVYKNPNRGYPYIERKVEITSERPEASIEYALYDLNGNFSESSSNFKGHRKLTQHYVDQEMLERRYSYTILISIMFLLLALLILNWIIYRAQK